MTTITVTPGMSLLEIAYAAYRAAPSGIDFKATPDGNISFTDEARPNEQFHIGPDTEYAGEDVDGVTWAEWTIEEDVATGHTYADFAGADGCNLSDPTDLVKALTRWIDAELGGTLMSAADAQPIGPATREQVIASCQAAPEGTILIDQAGNVHGQDEFGAESFRAVYVV